MDVSALIFTASLDTTGLICNITGRKEDGESFYTARVVLHANALVQLVHWVYSCATLANLCVNARFARFNCKWKQAVQAPYGCTVTQACIVWHSDTHLYEQAQRVHP